MGGSIAVVKGTRKYDRENAERYNVREVQTCNYEGTKT